MKIINGFFKILKTFFVLGLVLLFVVAVITLLTKEESEK